MGGVVDTRMELMLLSYRIVDGEFTARQPVTIANSVVCFVVVV